MSILGIVDHKIVHEEETVMVKQLDKCTLITTSAWRLSNNAACGGVGVLLNKAAEQCLAEIKPISERILVAEFTGNPKTTVIIHYAPTEGSDGAEQHYEMLSNVVNSIPKHNLILELGDFNAHLGRDNFSFAFHENTNKNGRLLVEHCTETNLLGSNLFFMKRPGKQWTFMSDMNDTKSQIDLILVNKK